MSKELVISANRHETRVAVVEDDQVVEVYHQRENEYSLAGSIHKGRVTRVLPGMQSAFVDIGLDRDAFLYVSDFFEDNEEYDKIVTSVEEKILKLDRSPQPSPAPAQAVAAAPALIEAEVLSTGVAEAPAVTEPAASVAQAPAATPAAGAPADQRRDDRGGRGRRGRRRRGPKGSGGRGLPESKFYSPGQRSAAEPEAPPVEAAAPPAQYTAPPVQHTAPPVQPAPAATDDDFFVLPGESLAKYTRPEGDEPEFGEPEANEAPELPIATLPGPVEAAPLPEAETAGDPEPVTTDSSEEERPSIAEEASPAEMQEPETAEISAAESAAESLSDEEGPEPARIPTSLTATLREQGSHYLHRVSRRMRRKGRGGSGDPARAGQPEGRSEGRPEGRSEESPSRTAPPPRNAPEQRVAPAAGNGRPDKSAGPSISDLLKEGQEIIVQIAKEPLGQKGARITSHIALPGRFLVYMPTVDHIGVSRKIPSDEERSRLKRILQTHRTGIPGGFIVRTAGDGHTEEELRADMMFLYNLWLDLRQKAERKPAPALMHHDLNVVERILRDQLTSAFKSIWVDNEDVYESVLRFVQRFQPALVSRVKMYTRSNPIFDEFGITAELEKALRPKVWLKSGGYIVINQTEALVAIDVNTGKFVGKSNRLEDTIVKTNTDAIKEIVRQIRLRDLGGIIVVDFIDMDERKNRQKVMQSLEETMRADRAPYKILQFNDFGLVAITRKRVKQSLERTLCMPCPYCEGAGYVKSAQTVVGEILQEAHKISKSVEGKDVMLRVAPDVAKMLKSNQNSYLQELEEILGRTVIVKSDAQLHQEKFDLA
jgi:ribonuclease G